MNASGVLHLDAPAEALFMNAEALSKSVTRDFFVNLFENQFKDSMLASVEELTSFKQDVKDAQEARQRMFSEAFTNPRAMNLTVPVDQQHTEEQAASALRQAKSEMDEALPNYTQLSKKFDEVDTRWIESHRAKAHLACGNEAQTRRLEEHRRRSQGSHREEYFGIANRTGKVARPAVGIRTSFCAPAWMLPCSGYMP